MKNFLRMITIFVFVFAASYAQTVTPIINLHENNSSGEPKLNGQTVTISGIVTASNQFGSAGPGAVQDSTGGISIYGSGFASKVEIGDSVDVTAKVSGYNGLTELNFGSGSVLTNHGKASKQIQPTEVTLSEISGQTWNGTEEYEGNLIIVRDVTISGSGSFSGGSSGKNYTITDATGSLAMRIDESTDIVGTTIPGTPIDIIAICAQYDNSSPRSDGYQILPRKIDDLVASTPVILSPVVASNITTTSFTVYFTTVREGDTEVRYGETSSLEKEPIKINENVLQHSVKIDNLTPLTKYYFQAASTNAGGTSEGPIQSVITSSTDTTIGTINVYFRNSVDNSVAIPGNEAEGNVDFESKLIKRINAATVSMDFAVYSFSNRSDLAGAIIAAKNRGVKVRFVYHDRTVQNSVQSLLNAGIKMVQRNSSTSGLMHNKFAIFDARDNNPANDWVWTGSFNWTSLEDDWENNVIEINDPSLAIAYTQEFEEMWGSHTDTPNSSAAKFGPDKTDNTSHSFSIGGISVESYFSPSDHTESKITSAMNSADSSIYFSVFSFTSNPISDAISARHNGGVNDIRGIIDNINDTGSEFQRLSGFAEMFDYNKSGRSLHHKYGIIDAVAKTSDPIVVTGSHNWSASANNKNDENTLIIHDVFIANQFMQEFKSRYNDLGGTTSFTVPVITSVAEKGLYPTEVELNQNYPNPFNPITTITFFLPRKMNVNLSVYNALGEKVIELLSGERAAGLNVVDFDAGKLSSGLYIYRLLGGGVSLSRKMVVLK